MKSAAVGGGGGGGGVGGGFGGEGGVAGRQTDNDSKKSVGSHETHRGLAKVSVD